MWYYDSQIIRTPKVMVINDITHPKGIFTDSAMLVSLGIKPYREVTKDIRYYEAGSYSVDTSGDEVVGTYAGTARSAASLQADMLSKIKESVSSKLTHIDWYWQRKAKVNTAVPSAISDYATALYSEYATKKTEIGNLNTIAKCIEYEARAYTETRKSEDYDADGNFTGFHASKTYTISRKSICVFIGQRTQMTQPMQDK
jgi:hypothetical protein